ncbi:TPA: hypothetical protein N0F65_011397 [Lagenidium giganteum]|uniref:Uncharacterized protein n=1 Tax=Lagenidium giganteum TaxID=4803 RepID=A0AAV2ZAZ8_9STRA|nr:TPA: hypothetical protein N0F65_011397 [Lagenidium giganteum]
MRMAENSARRAGDRRSPATAANGTNNTLFLAVVCCFCIVYVLPVLVASLVRVAMAVSVVLLIAAATNPSDHAFAVWISQQENVRMTANPTVKQWFSAVVKTALAAICNEDLSWVNHNVLFFSVVYVPALERRAFGCFGGWCWADWHPQLKAFCEAPWIARFANGGAVSGVNRYLAGQAQTRAPSSRSARATTGTMFSAQQPRSQASSVTDRELRGRAMQLKLKKEWSKAAAMFMEAANMASSVLSQCNHRLEAAWCELEDAKSFPQPTAHCSTLVMAVKDELVKGGFYDEAARALAEFALRLKRNFHKECRQERFARRVADVYMLACKTALQGDHRHSAIEHGLRAAELYSSVMMWNLAERAFQDVGNDQLELNNVDMAREALNCSVLCGIGHLDMVAAKRKFEEHREVLRSFAHSSRVGNDMDELLESIFGAYERWSLAALKAAVDKYERSRRLAPWQKLCIQAVQDKLSKVDLR